MKLRYIATLMLAATVASCNILKKNRQTPGSHPLPSLPIRIW